MFLFLNFRSSCIYFFIIFTSCYRIEEALILDPGNEICIKSISNAVSQSLKYYYNIDFRTQKPGLKQYIQGLNSGRHKYLRYDLKNGENSIRMKFTFSAKNNCELVLVQNEYIEADKKSIDENKSAGLANYPIECKCKKKDSVH